MITIKIDQQNKIQSQSVVALLISAGVPGELLDTKKHKNIWSAYDVVLIPTSILRDICLMLGIDQIKNRQNFRNWVREVTGLDGIPEGQLTVITKNKSIQIIRMCLSNLAKTSSEGYKNILEVLAENILFKIISTGFIDQMLVELPALATQQVKLRLSTSGYIFLSVQLTEEGEKQVLKNIVPAEFFDSLEYSDLLKNRVINSMFLLEHIRQICYTLGLNLSADKQLISQWLCKEVGIVRLADSKGLTLLTFEQSVNVIAIALCRLVKIYSGQRLYIDKSNITESLRSFAYEILMKFSLESDATFASVLSKTDVKYYPTKRLKGGNVI
jgi:hypothetical protein